MRAVIAGGGIGGLAAAVALHRRGIQVSVLERAAQLDLGGAGLSLWPNALRALDRLGVGDPVREHAVLSGTSGVRRPDGRWIARTQLGPAIQARFGDPLVVVHRGHLARLLAEQLPPDTVRYGTAVIDVADHTRLNTVLTTTHGVLPADLVVAADGIRSTLRSRLFPAAPGPRYAGFTAWRMVVDDPGGTLAAETWGPHGQRFAILPLADGQCYCYATAAVPAETDYDDGAAELRRRFADWHPPIQALLATLNHPDVLRNDIEELPPLPAMHSGRVALLGDAAHAMTPDLGQGACLALEDAVVLAALVDPSNPASVPAALHHYTTHRLPRTRRIARRSSKAGALYHRSQPIRLTAARLLGIMPAGLLARGMSDVLDWLPPPLPEPTS